MRTTEMVLFAHFLKTSKFIPACISIYILSLIISLLFSMLMWIISQVYSMLMWIISLVYSMLMWIISLVYSILMWIISVMFSTHSCILFDIFIVSRRANSWKNLKFNDLDQKTSLLKNGGIKIRRSTK